MSTLNSQCCVVALASPAFSQDQAFCRGGRVIAPFVSMARREKSRDRSRRRERSRKGRSRSRRRERRCSRGRERRRSSPRPESETPERASVRTEAPDVENTRGGGGGDNALIRRAAALRTKYKKHATLVRIPVMQIGCHPDNRDGQGPSGCRCLELTSKILTVGFDAVEADANGVLVEQKPGSTHIADANKRFANGDALLAPILDGQVSYGTLSHSTLNQLMRNIFSRCPIVGGDATSVVTECPGEGDAVSRIVDQSGKLSVGLLQQVDPAFATAVQSGLCWEILSHAIEQEEPDGCAVIQSALNAKNGLFLVAHEMQALSRLMTLTSSSAVAGARLSWQSVYARVQETLPEFSDDKNFIDLYSFVVDLGGAQSFFLQDLKSFHQRFVNPKKRRVRLEAFASANALPIEMPHLKVASLKYVYVDAKVNHGYCASISFRAIKTMLGTAEGRAASVVAESILRFFHVDCKQALNNQEHFSPIQFIGNLDKDIFGKLLCTEPPAHAETAVRSCGAKWHKRLVKAPTGAKVPKYTFGEEQTTANASGAVAVMQPQVIKYDSRGRPLSKQEEHSSQSREEYGWSQFMASACVKESMNETCMKTLILAHLHMLHFQLPAVTEAHLKMVKGDIRAGGVRVVAVSAMEEGTVRMAPMVTGGASLARLTKETTASHLKVRVTRQGETSEWCLTGLATLPTASAVADQGGVVTQHSWKPFHFPWPLWYVKRVSDVKEANCTFEEVDQRFVGVFDQKQRGEPIADNCDVVVPVLVNNKALAAGEELKVLWSHTPVAKKDKGSKVTWASQARLKLGKIQHQQQKK